MIAFTWQQEAERRAAAAVEAIRRGDWRGAKAELDEADGAVLVMLIDEQTRKAEVA